MDEDGQPSYRPHKAIIATEWTAIRQQLQFLASAKRTKPLPPPSPETSTRLANLVKGCFDGKCALDYCLECIALEVVNGYEHRGLLRSLMSVVLSYRMFTIVKNLIEKEHSKIYSKMYAMIHAEGDLEAVQYADLRATKSLIEGSDFQSKSIQPAHRYLAEFLDGDLRKIFQSHTWSCTGNSDTMPFEQVSKKAIRLVLKLMITTVDYITIFFEPGVAFNADWMEAEDGEGMPRSPEHCAFQRVRLCLFPALAQQERDLGVGDPNDISAALASNRSIDLRWHSAESTTIAGERISKAVVVLG